MRKPLKWISVLALAAFGPVIPTMAVPTIVVGTIELEPNKPGQIAEIYVTGGDAVRVLELFVQVGNGGPELELTAEDFRLSPGAGIPGPAITAVDLLTGTVFATNNLGQQNPIDAPIDFPQLAAAYTQVSSGTVVAEGLLARLSIDTTGFASGTFALSLTAYGVTTEFDGASANVTDGLLIVGGGTPQADQPPIADAGADQSVDGGTAVLLAGTGSDPEGAGVTYQWRQTDGPTVVLTNSATATASFTAPTGTINTQLTFEFSVSDGVNTTTDTVTIKVNADDSLFTVDAGPDQSVSAGALVQLDAVATTQTPRTFTYEWIQVGGPTVALTAAGASGVTFIAPVGVTNTALSFEVRVFDGTYEAVDTVAVTVNANSAAPAAYAGEDQTVAAGATVQLVGSGTDPAGLGLSYLWVQIDGTAVQLSSETIAEPSFTAPSASVAGRLEFELRVSSGALTSVDTVVIQVAAAAPAISETPADPSPDAEQTTSQTPLWEGFLSALSAWISSREVALGISLLIVALIYLLLFLL